MPPDAFLQREPPRTQPPRGQPRALQLYQEQG